MKTRVRPIFLNTLIVVILGTGTYAFVHREELLSPCLPPLTYRVADVDQRFGISRETVKKLALQAETVWENPLGKDVLRYSEEADFVVRLVYDERQQNTFHARALESEIDENTAIYDTLASDLENKNVEIEKLATQYNSLLSAYESDVQQLNREIGRWNTRGGAPEDVYTNFIETQQDLDERRSELVALATRINERSQNTQNLVNTINETASVINTNVETYNSLFADMPVFDKGIYNGGEIILYQFETQNDLLLTLVHEFGHALGIGHLESAFAVMHPLIQDQSIDPIRITADDVAAARTVCRFD